MSKLKKLSNSFSTGGGGVHFEAHVQASFVALMLTGGHAPCLPCWPIAEIKLQGKIDGFDTDDLVVVVENVNSKERRKLLGQVKHSIPITQGSTLFGEVMQAAWNDFKNPKVFTRDKDIIALITGPLSATDAHNVQWLLNQARHTKNVDEFFRNVQQANFSPAKSTEKLEVIQHHLKVANGGNDVSRDELYDFLNHFHLLGYDLGNEFGVVLSLLHSHISQFQQQYPQWVWSRVVDIVQTWNQDAGTITPGKLPDDLLDAFKQKAVAEMPEEFKAAQEKPKTDWAQHPDATYLALAILIGSWQEKSQCDLEAITQLLGISYDEWLKKAREILHCPDSPLSLKNGIWKVVNRAELWSLLGSRILDQNLDTFRSLAVSVLKEPDPAFELPAEERYAASIHGKVLKCSHVLRKGIAEGLAILGSQPESCANCSQGKAEATCVLVIRELLIDADWVLWGSLNGLLPTLAEAAPGEFLDAVEKAMRLTPCPFVELFAQEGNGITGGNYLTGLLWALEGLAWDEQYLVRVSVALAELASHDPGGQWANRPSNSLATILLPWLPQTLGSIEKRKVAVQTVLAEQPEVGWNLLLQLLPGHHQVSSGSHKPGWRKFIPEDWEKGVSHKEYWDQVSAYSELAVRTAGADPGKLTHLVSRLDDLVRPSFDELLNRLKSDDIAGLLESQRREIWDALVSFAGKHRKFEDAEWALPGDAVGQIEEAAKTLAPKNPFDLHQYLFNERDFDLYEEKGDWQEQLKKLEAKREAAIQEILSAGGISEVLRFAEAVRSPRQVGLALGGIANDSIDQHLLPDFLDRTTGKLKDLVDAYILRRYSIMGWEWCDGIVRSDWTLNQKAGFLCQLPFSKDTWDRVTSWLGSEEGLYWSAVWANPYQSDEDLSFAVAKLIEFKRPHPAIDCLYKALQNKQAIIVGQAVQALLLAVSSTGRSNSMDTHHIVELIKFLQSEPSISQDDLFRIEWAYLPLLGSLGHGKPKLLEHKLATDPEFFCEIIRLIYRSEKEDAPPVEHSEDAKAIATNAWRLLHDWRTPPGTQIDGSFSGQRFTQWLETTKAICTESGHLDIALIQVGEVLIHVPSDANGLWIDATVASALNGRDDEHMRRGFSTAVYNSRGVHWVDPTGKPEKELAEEYRRKAEDVENVGFQRFAVALRGLADGYDREADRIVAEHQQEDRDE